MKDMIKRVREEKGGFTLAELLIVVAIILVLVAIAIPVFTGASNQAAEAVEKANQRSVKAEFTSEYLLATTKPSEATYYVDEQGNVTTTSPGTGKGKSYKVTVDATNQDKPVITVATGEEIK